MPSPPPPPSCLTWADVLVLSLSLSLTHAHTHTHTHTHTHARARTHTHTHAASNCGGGMGWREREGRMRLMPQYNPHPHHPNQPPWVTSYVSMKIRSTSVKINAVLSPDGAIQCSKRVLTEWKMGRGRGAVPRTCPLVPPPLLLLPRIHTQTARLCGARRPGRGGAVSGSVSAHRLHFSHRHGVLPEKQKASLLAYGLSF